jgi:hypothetical protein
MKLREWIYQATMQMNVSGPVTTLRRRGRRSSCMRKTKLLQRYGKETAALPGSEAAAWYKMEYA